MKIVSWNIRGLNNPHKQDMVRNMIRDNKPDIVLLQETKVPKEKVESLSLLKNGNTKPLEPKWGDREDIDKALHGGEDDTEKGWTSVEEKKKVRKKKKENLKIIKRISWGSEVPEATKMVMLSIPISHQVDLLTRRKEL